MVNQTDGTKMAAEEFDKLENPAAEELNESENLYNETVKETAKIEQPGRKCGPGEVFNPVTGECD